MPFNNGTLLTNAGVIDNNVVAGTYVPIATDVYINGRLHSNLGEIYLTADADDPGDVFINGQRCTVNGVVRIAGVPAQNWPEGFSSTATGRWVVGVSLGPNFIHGMNVEATGVAAITI